MTKNYAVRLCIYICFGFIVYSTASTYAAVRSSLFSGNYETIREDLIAWIYKMDNNIKGNDQVGAKLNCLWQSYQACDNYYNRFTLSQFSRMWTYDAALALYAVTTHADYKRARKAVDNFMNLLNAEKKRGYRGLFHFSYNGRGDSYIDPREPQGATQWALKAILAYMLTTGDTHYFEELCQHIRNDVFPLQILNPNHPAYGLLRQGYTHPNGLSEDGYYIYHDLDKLNMISHRVNLEHNADYVDTLRLMATLLDRYHFLFNDIGSDFRNELRQRHALSMQALLRVRDGNYWPTAFDEGGHPNWSRAVDHYTWLSHIFVGIDNNDDIPWKSIRILADEFTTTISSMVVLDKKEEQSVPLRRKATGLFYFQEDFEDSYVTIPFKDKDKLEKMIQPEGTAGAICFCLDYADITTDPARRVFALEFADTLLKGLEVIHQSYNEIPSYKGGGMPYATEFIYDYFCPDPSMASSAAYYMALTRSQREIPYYLGVAPPRDFKTALTERVDPYMLPAAIEIPVFDFRFAKERIDPTWFTVLQAKVTGGLFKLQMTYPDQLKDFFEIIILKKSDVWYVQPRSVGARQAGHDIPRNSTLTTIKSLSSTLNKNALLLITKKGHTIQHDSQFILREIDNMFQNGTFIKGFWGNGNTYHPERN